MKIQSVKQIQRTSVLRRSFFAGQTMGHDISQFFYTDRWAANQELQIIQNIKKFTQTISPLASWLIVFYAICNNAAIPAWNMSVGSNKYLKISWRFLMQALVMTPFTMFQKRKSGGQAKEMYKIFNILKNIKPLFSFSLHQVIFTTLIMTQSQFTFISHSLVLGALQNFFLSMLRIWYKEQIHPMERGGQILVLLGILLMLIDSFTLNPQNLSSDYFQVGNSIYLYRKWWVLILGDLGALLASAFIAICSLHGEEAKQIFPPFLLIQLSQVINSALLALAGYFLCGIDFLSTDKKWGYLGIFGNGLLTNYLYMSIIITLGLMITSLLIKEMFPPMVPAIAAQFEPLFSIIMVDILDIQKLPGSYGCIACALIMPGLVVIIIGQVTLASGKQNPIQVIKQAVSSPRLSSSPKLRISRSSKLSLRLLRKPSSNLENVQEQDEQG